MFKFPVSVLLVSTCLACGGSFSANEGDGSQAGAGGDANAGQSNSAGSSSAGDTGDPGNGGTSSGGTGGSATGGKAGDNGGSTGGTDCAKLKQQYQSQLEKARACDQGSMDQCNPSSTVEPLSCGCAVLVNSKTVYADAARKAQKAYQDAKCAETAVCPAIACAAVKSASCAAPATGGAFVCTAGSPTVN